MSKTVLITVSTTDFDPTEIAVPWRALTNAGFQCLIATPMGKPASADPVMVTGARLGLAKKSMMADSNGVAAYRALESSGALSKTISFSELKPGDFDALLIPGGHAPGMREALGSETLQKFIGGYFATGKPVAAICHGVLAAARSRDPRTGKSVLYGKRTTALPSWMENFAWNLTRLWMGNYYRTYSLSVQEEVTNALKDRKDFDPGPWSFSRDSADNLKPGFVVRDGNYLSARWPGDAHLFASEFLKMLA